MHGDLRYKDGEIYYGLANFQPRLMSAEETETFLSRLAFARPNKTPN